MVCAVAWGAKAMGEEMNEAELERVKLHNQMYLEYNKLVIENAMRAQRGLLLCHGGAITAILMSGKTWLMPYCVLFGAGAILAVLSTGLGYLANLSYMSTWSEYTVGTTSEEATKKQKRGVLAHRSAIVAFLLGVLCFVANLWQIFGTM